MAPFQVEVVIRPIQVGRHHRNEVGAVLQVEALAHLQPRNLGDGIRFVGILQRARQQRILRHGLGRLLRVDAGAPQEEQLLHPVAPALTDHVILYLQIAIDKIGPVGVVGHDPAHVRRSQKHVLRLHLLKEAGHSHAVHQVQFTVCPSYQVEISLLFQIVPDRRAHQPPVSGYIYFCVFVHTPILPSPNHVSSSSSPAQETKSLWGSTPAAYAPSSDHPAAVPPPQA